MMPQHDRLIGNRMQIEQPYRFALQRPCVRCKPRPWDLPPPGRRPASRLNPSPHRRTHCHCCSYVHALHDPRVIKKGVQYDLQPNKCAQTYSWRVRRCCCGDASWPARVSVEHEQSVHRLQVRYHDSGLLIIGVRTGDDNLTVGRK